jgi:hypothetical protein
VKSEDFFGAFFSAAPKKNRAFRSKSSALPMQSLRAFRCNPLRAHGLFAGLHPGRRKRRDAVRANSFSTLRTHFINKNNNLSPSLQAQSEELPNCPQFGSSHHQ